MFTNPFGFVHSSDMIGRYTHTRKQANLFFPLFSFFFLFYTNRTGLPHTRQAGSVLSVRFIMRRLQQATANPKTFRRIRTAPRRGRRLCRPEQQAEIFRKFRANPQALAFFTVGADAHIGPLGSCEFAEDYRKNGVFFRADVGIGPYR